MKCDPPLSLKENASSPQSCRKTKINIVQGILAYRLLNQGEIKFVNGGIGCMATITSRKTEVRTLRWCCSFHWWCCTGEAPFAKYGYHKYVVQACPACEQPVTMQAHKMACWSSCFGIEGRREFRTMWQESLREVLT